MAIREFSLEGTPRAKIAFVGEVPSQEDLKRFSEHKFTWEPSNPADPVTLNKLSDPDFIAKLDAVIWTQDATKLKALPRELRGVARKLLDHDVRIYVRLASDENKTAIPRKHVVNAIIEDLLPANLQRAEWQTLPQDQRERENSLLFPCIYIVDTANSWGDIAALVCSRPASPIKLNLNFDEKILLDRFGREGHEERVNLLKRAFWNCSDLRLTLLDGGMSGAPVFKAYASLEAGLVQQGSTSPYPHLFFVKIGPRKKITDEYDKYCSHISEYVPFHLGPRLRLERCNLGSKQGILVGDFVEGAETLIACARGGRCGHAIANLFDKTLGGWRKQERAKPVQSLSSQLAQKWYVEGQKDKLIEVPAERIPLLHKLQADTQIGPLKEMFEQLGKAAAFAGPAHGDMHATNVLVRHGDAIIIDFEKLEQQYPLTYDPASLEGGLLVEGFIEDLKAAKLSPESVVSMIAPLYEGRAFKVGQTTYCRPGDPTEWYYNAVNQIRTLSWSAENEPCHYALTLALCLIRKGCNPHQELNAKEPNALRAIAFFFGQKILREMASTKLCASQDLKPASEVEGQ